MDEIYYNAIWYKILTFLREKVVQCENNAPLTMIYNPKRKQASEYKSLTTSKSNAKDPLLETPLLSKNLEAQQSHHGQPDKVPGLV